MSVKGPTMAISASATAFAVSHPSGNPYAKLAALVDDDFGVPARITEMATYEMRDRLPALADDDKIGVECDYLLPRDGEADYRFTGSLVASAAPPDRGQERWREYRVYRTKRGRFVFSKIGRSIRDSEHDKFEAWSWSEGQETEYQDGSFDVIHPKCSTLAEAAVHFFGYDQLAKELYAKLGVDTAERLE
jgi:EXLDI family protein